MFTDMLLTATLSYISLDAEYINSSRVINAIIDPVVDVDSSEFIYEGLKLTPSDKKIFFEVIKEGETTFSYVLRDKEGQVLESKDINITLDSISPKIQLSVNKFELENVIYVEDKLLVNIQAIDEHLQELEVYVDGKLQSDLNYEAFEVTKDMHNIQVKAKDEIGNVTEQEFHVEKIEIPQIQFDVEKDAYILNPMVNVQSEHEDIVTIDVFCDERLEDTIEYTKQTTVNLSKTGDYTFMISYKKAPYIQWYLDYFFHFSNEDLYLALVPSQIQSNSDIFVHLDWSKRYVQQGYVEIYNGRTWVKRDLIEEIVFQAIPQQENRCIARAILIDCFGRKIEKQIEVITDLKAPEIVLQTKNRLLNPHEINRLSKEEVLSYYVLDNSCLSYKLRKNGEILSDVSINQALQGLCEDDLLEIEFVAQDSLLNTSHAIYKVMIEPYQLKQEIIKTQVTTPSFQEEKLVEHEFVVKDNKIVHKTIKKKPIDRIQPSIRFIRLNDNKTRIVLLKNDSFQGDRFESILIDGKSVDLNTVKKDAHGNAYYEISRLMGRVDVQVVAKDKAGNKAEAKQLIHFTPPFEKIVIYPVIAILALLACTVKLLKKHHGKNFMDS